MNEFKNMFVEIWRSECGSGPVSRSTNYFAIRADLHRPMRERKKILSDEVVVEEDTSYLGYIWFLFEEKEFRVFASGKSTSFQDGMHVLDTSGDDCMFYDNIRYQSGMSRAKGPNGKVEVPYFNATIPIFWRRMMLKVANRIWRGLEKAQAEAIEMSKLANASRYFGNDIGTDYAWAREAPKVRIDFDQKARDRIVRLYGQGKGQVEIEIGAGYGAELEQVKQQIEHDMQDPGFARQYENKIQIARNTTLGFHQTAKLSIRLDNAIRPGEKSPGYYWVAKNPRNQAVLVGGLIDHRRSVDEAPSWSSHT